MERGLTVWSSLSADDPKDRPELFTALIEHAEGLREDRRKHGPLVCRNIALFGPTDIDSASELMWWPAWLARNLYAPVQVMVGRFFIGIEIDDSKGEAMMPPPVSFWPPVSIAPENTSPPGQCSPHAS